MKSVFAVVMLLTGATASRAATSDYWYIGGNVHPKGGMMMFIDANSIRSVLNTRSFWVAEVPVGVKDPANAKFDYATIHETVDCNQDIKTVSAIFSYKANGDIISTYSTPMGPYPLPPNSIDATIEKFVCRDMAMNQADTAFARTGDQDIYSLAHDIFSKMDHLK